MISEFSRYEFAQRREAARRKMAERGLDACLITCPENIYYLTGLDHMGYFAFQALALPADGEPRLITRAMERAVVRDMAPDLLHRGYPDGSFAPTGHNPRQPVARGAETMEPGPRPQMGTDEPPAVAVTARTLSDMGLQDRRVGLEKSTNFLPPAITEGLRQRLPDTDFVDASGLVDALRIRQSEHELDCTRAAARISDDMMLAAIATAGVGVNKRDVMASIYSEMCRRGGTYPGFVPLVRATTTLEHEHGTWQDYVLAEGDLLFLEMAGCVRRYHAPMGRLVFIGEAPPEAERANRICRDATHAAAESVRPGVKAADVYAAWQRVLDASGLADYRRHHCGYSVGIGYPPSWSGSGAPVGLRPGSTLRLEAGMVFHLMSWMLRSPLGDAFVSDTIVVTDSGCEFLTTVPSSVTVRR